jgi:hypothetical protein
VRVCVCKGVSSCVSVCVKVSARECVCIYSGPLTYELNSFARTGRNSSWS